MTDEPHETFEHDAERHRLAVACLNKRLARIQPSQSRLRPPAGNSAPCPGQLWHARVRAAVPFELPEGCASDDPHTVLVLESGDEALDGRSWITVAPVDPFDDMAGPDDLLLPRRVLGYDAVVRLSASVGMLFAGLEECLGELPEEDFRPIEDAYDWVSGFSESDSPPEGVVFGRNYLFPGDSRWTFHERLVESLGYLQGPLMVCLERAEAAAEAARVEVPLATWFTDLRRRFGDLAAEGREAVEVALGALCPAPAHAAALTGSIGRAAVLNREEFGRLLAEELVELATDGNDGFFVLRDEGPESDPDDPERCYARWRIESPPEMLRGGERFVLFELSSQRIIGAGFISESRRTATLKEGLWIDFEKHQGEAEGLFLLVERSDEDPGTHSLP